MSTQFSLSFEIKFLLELEVTKHNVSEVKMKIQSIVYFSSLFEKQESQSILFQSCFFECGEKKN